MEVANTIIQLCAYREMFASEIAQIDTDLLNLNGLAERYPPMTLNGGANDASARSNNTTTTTARKGLRSAGRGRGATDPTVAVAFSKPAVQLQKLRAEKVKKLDEVQRQLELFQLHLGSANKLVKNLTKVHGGGTVSAGTTSTTMGNAIGGTGTDLVVPVVNNYSVTLASDIATQ